MFAALALFYYSHEILNLHVYFLIQKNVSFKVLTTHIMVTNNSYKFLSVELFP